MVRQPVVAAPTPQVVQPTVSAFPTVSVPNATQVVQGQYQQVVAQPQVVETTDVL